MIAVAKSDGTVHFGDAGIRNVRKTIYFEKVPLALRFSPDDTQVFIVDEASRFFSYELVGF